MNERASGFNPPRYDVAVIGGGVIGCATFREFILAGAHAILLEQDSDLLAGASKGNSGLLHTGFDATPGTLEAQLMQEGRRAYLAIRERLNLPLITSGAILAAWREEELAQLDLIVARARANSVADVRRLSRDEVLLREPNLARSLLGGVEVPNESVIDPWSAPLAYAEQGLANGGSVLRGAAVADGVRSEAGWRLKTSRGAVEASVVINCAGNFGDLVEAIARSSPFRIRPRKGQFVVFDKFASRLTRGIILPVPTERTKGVLISPTAFGNLIVGPTAEDQDDRRDASVDGPTLKALVAEGRRILPGLTDFPITAAFAGLRPATEFKDYQIEALADLRWITVSGIRSTGLTAALGVAAYVRALYEERFAPVRPLSDPVWTPVPNLTEGLPRPYALPGRSEIVCHCEQVTRGEIEAALSGALGAATIGGLRRRTRCMLGRCQGFYCTRRVIELAAGRIAEWSSAGGER